MAKRNINLALDPNLLFATYVEYLKENRLNASPVTFGEFLKDNGLSVTHANELYYHFTKGNKLSIGTFKMRKTHPKRDAFIKKGVVPTLITAAGVGGVLGVIAGSGLIGGSTVLGLIPVSGTPGLTAIATGLVGAAAGIVLTPAILKIKKAVTKLHYKTWYKSAKKNLKEYKKGTSLESLYIASLMDKIQKTKTDILKMSAQNKFAQIFTFIPKHIKNAVNRNRIHHLEAYTHELVDMYNLINSNNIENKNEKLKPIYDLLKHVETFVSNDLNESKIFTMLTCKEKGNHSHASMFENVDIFANLTLYINTELIKNNKQKQKEAKASSKNLRRKKEVAHSLLNGDRLIAKMVANLEETLDIDDNAKIFDIDEEVIFPKENSEKDVIVVKEFTVVEDEQNQPMALPGYEIKQLAEPKNNEVLEEDNTFDIDKNQISIDLSQFEKQKEVMEFTFGEEFQDEEIDKIIKEISKEIEDSSKNIAEEEVEESTLAESTTDDDNDNNSNSNNQTQNTVNPSTPSLLTKLSRRLTYKASPITSSGQTVGATLTVKNDKGETETVKIRYLSSKKKIRIQNITEKGTNEEFVKITDSVIPPINQMNELLALKAEEKHLDNVDSLSSIF